MKPDDIFDNTLSELINEAMSDGKITEDEFNILEQVSQDVMNYVDKLDVYRSKGTITKEEGKILRQYKQKLIDNAEKSSILGSNNEVLDSLIEKLNTIVSSKYKKY